MKPLFVFVAVLLVFSQTYAASDITFGLFGVSSSDGTCTGGAIDLGAGYSGSTVDYSVFDVALITLTDGYGTLLDSRVLFSPSTGSVYGEHRLSFGISGGGYADIAARPITLTLYDLSGDPQGIEPAPLYAAAQNDPILAQFNYDPSPQISDCENLPTLIQDVPKLAEAQIVVASMPEGEDLMGLDVWGISPTGEGYKAFYITGGEFNALTEEPEEPVLIQQTDEGVYPAISFYKLSTGEYQFNIGPYENGDVQVVIFNGVPPSEVYRADYNIYDPVP